MNIIPTTTGAARAVGAVMPELDGHIHGMAFRVPTSTVSLIDLVAVLEREATVAEVNEAFKEASLHGLHGILEYCEEELVSVDFKGNPHSCIFDAPSTMSLGGNLIKAIGWYDNEWGYSCRTADLASFLVDRGL